MLGKTEMEQNANTLHLEKKSREEKEQAWKTNIKKSAGVPPRSSNLRRAGSVKDLIGKFSGSDHNAPKSPSSPTGLFGKRPISAPSTPSSMEGTDSPDVSITVTPPDRETKNNPTIAKVDCPVEGDTEGGKTKTTDLSQSSCTVSSEDPNTRHSADTRDAVANSRPSMADSRDLMANSRPSMANSRPSMAESRPSMADSRDSVADSGIGLESEVESNKQLESPASEEEPTTPKIQVNQNPKYQLFLNNDLRTNGSSSKNGDVPRVAGGSMDGNGPRLSRWESSRLGPTNNHYKGSLESLASRDWETLSDRQGVVDSPPRVFNSPYSTAISMEYNPMNRMSEFKSFGGLSPATSELNLYSFNGRSTSPVPCGVPPLTTRTRISTYDTLARRRAGVEVNNVVAPGHYSLRSNTMGAPNKRDYIEELTKQMEACQKRNQFLEAESVEMEKERNQIRFEMRGLLVNNEDLLRTNTQLTNELKRTREQMIEMDREHQGMAEKFRSMEVELKDARHMMVEANTQEYAFNFLQQTLKNKIQDAEENLEKQTVHAQTLAEKLWLTERQLEELTMDSDSRDKKSAELNTNIFELETELAEALQVSTQTSAELSLQQKLREDAQQRVEELEESILEKDQELLRLQGLVNRLQEEVSGKLIDKEQTLEEEIQLRERMQLQWKQAERTVEDLQMELHTANQAKEDLIKQIKQAQEKTIDLEADLEELHDSEQRWASKHKRAIEQTEQLQLKVIQERDLNEQLESEHGIMERQLREMRLEIEELQSSRVQEDVISRSETRIKELENALRTEERNKAMLTNTIGKLERKINEMSDQMEEEHKISNEQKDLMTQRIRTLKRQVNEAEEEASRKEAQFRHTQRELTEERETTNRLQKQLMDQQLQTKRKESQMLRQTLDNLRLDLSVDDEDDQPLEEQANSVTKV